MINIALELVEIGTVGAAGNQMEPKAGTIVCPNPDCCGGYMRSRLDPSLVRVCPSCDGFGYLRSTAENRKRYYAIRNLVSEIELQSHKGHGMSARMAKQNDPGAGENMFGQTESAPSYDEHMIVNAARLSSCYRVS